jgi:hypothetical protein
MHLVVMRLVVMHPAEIVPTQRVRTSLHTHPAVTSPPMLHVATSPLVIASVLLRHAVMRLAATVQPSLHVATAPSLLVATTPTPAHAARVVPLSTVAIVRRPIVPPTLANRPRVQVATLHHAQQLLAPRLSLLAVMALPEQVLQLAQALHALRQVHVVVSILTAVAVK